MRLVSRQIRWYDLDTFDKEWVKDKKVLSFECPQCGVFHSLVHDSDGKEVWRGKCQ